MQAVIQVQNLRHAFNGHKALDDISFEVQRGGVFGLLGPNGAGKTTSVRLLNGLYTPSSGQMNVLGHLPGQRLQRDPGAGPAGRAGHRHSVSQRSHRVGRRDSDLDTWGRADVLCGAHVQPPEAARVRGLKHVSLPGQINLPW